ncbi:hypothetical protein Btru_011433 [Bulinus truncatus]|nr:hypothetical protein Btru_011433 [Bulinus truncatus]
MGLGETYRAMSSKVHLSIAILCVLLMLGLLSGVGIYIWKNDFDESLPGPQTKSSDIKLEEWVSVQISNDGIHFHASNISSPKSEIFKGVLGLGLDVNLGKLCDDGGDKNGLCMLWEDKFRLQVFKSDGISRKTRSAESLQCETVIWSPLPNVTLEHSPKDCFDLNQFFWYGGFESSTQIWPMNNYEKNLTAFITADSFQGDYLGSAIEGIFLSSSGVGIVVDPSTPLYISVNSRGSRYLCLMGKVGNDTPFFNVPQPFLKYDVCQSSDIVRLWKSISNEHLPKPAGVPAHDLFRYPIWCTWAIYKENINQSTVLEYANSIRANNFSVSQLEIDDSWTPHYGDFNFTSDRFPDAVGLINNLTKMDIPATIWMHPFINSDSNAFRELAEKGFLIKSLDSKEPHLVSWWRGTNIAGVLDFTNPEAVNWYLDKLDYLKKTFNVTSFKFDAGELGWVSGKYRLNSSLITPNYLTQKYIEMTFQADTDQRRQEVRSGFRSQSSTIMLRMLDRLSDWSHTFGIKTLIPCSLVFGMMGYPYVLPDLIGGNAYGEGMPDPELFIRWLQATIFMPVLQFSIPPWFYNDTVIEISKKYIQLHEQYADKIINLAENAKNTGEPINRPLWWIAPQDEYALQIDSEFLLGDDLLVAPILDKGSTSRDIYLPNGQWRDEQKGQTLQGGVWIKNYSAPLDLLPYFTKLD